MLTAVVTSLVLVFLTCAFHYEVLRLTSDIVLRLGFRARARVPGIIFVALLSHLIQAGIYAATFMVAVDFLRLGEFQGSAVNGYLDYLYFSLVTYTSLGLGDVFPTGHIRFLTGVEALNGLLMIAWTGAFTYLAMGKLWPWDACHATENVSPPRRGAARP